MSSTLTLGNPISGQLANMVGLSNPSATHKMGETKKFIVRDENGGKRVVRAKMVASGDNTYIWVPVSENISKSSITELLKKFDEQIYQKNVEYFADKGAQNKVVKVNVLITDMGEAEGYFNPGDITGGNGMNLLYLDSTVARDEPDKAAATLAHEFAHMIYYYSGGANIEWLDEGLAVYAEYINGYKPSQYIEGYKYFSNVELDQGFSNTSESYGAAFLFVAYAVENVEKSGSSVPAFIKALIDSSNSGVKGFNKTFGKYISDKNFDTFAEIYQPHRLIGFIDEIDAAGNNTSEI